MNAEELTDIIFNSLKLDTNEWTMEFDDYNPQVIHLTHTETDRHFKLTISSND